MSYYCKEKSQALIPLIIPSNNPKYLLFLWRELINLLSTETVVGGINPSISRVVNSANSSEMA
jgi:hypothetical protein